MPELIFHLSIKSQHDFEHFLQKAEIEFFPLPDCHACYACEHQLENFNNLDSLQMLPLSHFSSNCTLVAGREPRLVSVSAV